MLQHLSRFVNDASGLEKTLRLSQSIAQIAAAYSISPFGWTKARGHFALARRYFRLTKWIDCWTLAQTHDYSVEGLLVSTKWAMLGTYLFLEMFTITNVMGITSTQWGPVLQVEALKFWFYSISVSILIGVYQVLGAQSTPAKGSSEPEGAKREGKKGAAEHVVKTRHLYKQLVIDGCDLLIPGSVVGWIQADSVTVGMASCVSTVLAGHSIWARVNGGRT